MQGILIFGGTTEGKRLAEYFEEIGVECIMSVATEYGRKVLPEHLQYCRVISGRMYPEEMLAFVRKHRIRLLIDATHPYAVEVTKNILQVCKSENIPYIRVSRPQTPRVEQGVYVASTAAAADYVSRRPGNILTTTGSKELRQYVAIPDYQERVYARILPLQQGVESALQAGFLKEHLICQKGPFCVSQNEEVLQKYQIKYLITKDSGEEGGFGEKMTAAENCGVTPVIIERPDKGQEMTVEEAKIYLSSIGGFVWQE